VNILLHGQFYKDVKNSELVFSAMKIPNGNVDDDFVLFQGKMTS
jgi:hypothetical protein